MTRGKCICGKDDCWEPGDNAWLSSQSGWHGELHGTRASVFFIHGRMIREQRHIPYGSFAVSDLPRLIKQWSSGLPGARLEWMADTGGGDPGLWIEGMRQPEPADWARLEEARARRRHIAFANTRAALEEFPDLLDSQ